MSEKKTDEVQLELWLNNAYQQSPRGRYQHHKGNYYWLEGFAFRESDLTVMAIYGPVGKDIKFVRPLSEFKDKFTYIVPGTSS